MVASSPPTDSRGSQHVMRQRSRNNRSSNNGIAALTNGTAGSNKAHPRVSKTNLSTHVIGSGRQGATCGIQAAQRHGRQSVTGGLFISRLAANTSRINLPFCSRVLYKRVKCAMAAVIIGDSQIKYLHRYVGTFDITTLS